MTHFPRVFLFSPKFPLLFCQTVKLPLLGHFNHNQLPLILQYNKNKNKRKILENLIIFGNFLLQKSKSNKQLYMLCSNVLFGLFICLFSLFCLCNLFYISFLFFSYIFILIYFYFFFLFFLVFFVYIFFIYFVCTGSWYQSDHFNGII